MASAGQEDPLGGEHHQKGNVVLHVREDSASEMEALFNVVHGNTNRSLHPPMRMRNLPKSFFLPPSVGSKSPSVHSRENSLDNSPFSPGPVPSPGPPPMGPVHSRASSCPATLGQPLAPGQPHQNIALNSPHAHLRQHSFDVGGGNAEDVLGPLPPGWEKAQTPTGQIYFMNHNNKTTQWEDPRKQLYANKIRALNTGTGSPRSAVSPVPQQPPQPPQTAQPHPMAAGGPQPQGPLPDGWEMKYTEAGEQYFIDHVTKKTQWQDPRINQLAQQQMLKLKQAQLKMLETKRQNLFQRSQVRPRSSSHENVAMSQAQEMMMRHSLNDGTTNIDPFLAGNQEAHNRQESADSGLGMGSNFNLGSIPEDMGLENMDTADLDTTLTEGNQPAQGGMETDQLIGTIGSLPELGEELSQDIMQTILKEPQPQPAQQPAQPDQLWL